MGLININSNNYNVDTEIDEYIEEQELAIWQEAAEHFKVYTLDPESAIKKNNLKEITNPRTFENYNKPTSDGLLSEEIFGLTMDMRSNTFAYIDLHATFISPLHYEILTSVDSNFRAIVHGTANFKINENGHLIKDPNGNTGLDWLIKNFNKINIKPTDSSKRDDRIKFLENNKKTMFIKKFIVIPAYYRDVDTNEGQYVIIGDINKLYVDIITSSMAVKDSVVDYGFNIDNALRGRVQEELLMVYKWFTDQLSGKFGIIKRANITKTTDYAARLVLSSANLNVENMDDMMVNMDKSAIPLSAACTEFYPFIIFHVKRFFDNEFGGRNQYKTIRNGKLVLSTLVNPELEFSDDEIKKQLNTFMHGFSNRFIPIKVKIKEDPGYVYMKFKGRQVTASEFQKGDYLKFPITDRYLTWCDVFYMAAVEASRDKTILITRYPIDSYFNQFPTKIEISTTKNTEPMVVGNEFYRYYPRIRQEDILKDTSNKFIDTCIIANPYTDAMGADFDGDTVTTKALFTIEANQELESQANSKSNFISLGGKNVRITAKEGIQSLYSLTLILSDTKLIDPES